MAISLDIAKLRANLIIKKAQHEKDQPESMSSSGATKPRLEASIAAS